MCVDGALALAVCAYLARRVYSTHVAASMS
jgi:hypothetical protein